MDKPLNAHNQNSINHLDFGQPPPEGFFARFKEFYDAATALDQLPLLDVPDWLSTYTATSIYSAISLNIQQAKPLIEAAPKFLENFLPPTYALREPTMTDQELQKLLHDLPSLKAPEGLAARVMERIQEDLLTQNLQGLKVKAPEGFAARIAERIQEDALKTELQSLKVTAPEGFASKVLQHIHSQSEA
ncbi:hypothetical protein, partial [Deinococcus misasensis]|uniref:hypothetical protein n=1 Tax=Deinococcus misasensis TaxID=392413 RepID=UPI00054DB285